MHRKILIGLTGSFGSGCSRLRKILISDFHFSGYKLSEEVREEAKRQGRNENDRYVLQQTGNYLRKTHGNGYLAIKALEKASADKNDKIVFHGLRNLEEISELRKFPNFYLVAIDCSEGNRWLRLKDKYNDDRRVFEKDDERDRDEGFDYGQQVLKCVEEADILFINEENYSTEQKINSELKNRFNTHLGLITGERQRNPVQDETMMTVASTLALQSHCIKRRVGAVLCDTSGFIVSAAYNEVPPGYKTCLDEFGMCYRDHVRKEFREEFLEGLRKFKNCPICKTDLIMEEGRVYCNNCKKNFADNIPPYKALDKCMSLHAEETTILKAAHYKFDNSKLYTTTFPCLQCAKRILQSNIKYVVYIDPYPEKESIVMLEKANVKTTKFEGVKAQAYYKLFQPYRETLEKEIRKQQ